MTEREKMLAGQLYDCGDAELLTQWHRAKDLVRDYNSTDSADTLKKNQILNELLGGRGEALWITAPFFADYGNNIYFGNNCEVNMNCTFLDDNVIRIGNNALIAPNVQIYTAFHPTNAMDRFGVPQQDGSFAFCRTQTAPVVIGDNVWIGGCHHWRQRGDRGRECGYKRYSQQYRCIRKSLPGQKGKQITFCMKQIPGALNQQDAGQ
jgi:maltose O-acetyltransferase